MKHFIATLSLLFLAATIIPGVVSADDADLDMVNARRIKFGLPVLMLDIEMQRIADIRMQINIDRGHWGHYRRFGRLLGPFKPARAEGVGYATSPERWSTCFSLTRKYTRAGAARKKVGNKYWQILILR